MPVLWDTTLVSRIQPSSPALDHFESTVDTEARVLVPAVAVTEIVGGYARLLPRPDAARSLRWLERFLTIHAVAVAPLGREAAFAAGRLRARSPAPPGRQRGERRTKPERRVAWVFDLQIASTAWALGIPLQTQNLTDHKQIAELLREVFPGAAPLEVQPSPL